MEEINEKYVSRIIEAFPKLTEKHEELKSALGGTISMMKNQFWRFEKDVPDLLHLQNVNFIYDFIGSVIYVLNKKGKITAFAQLMADEGAVRVKDLLDKYESLEDDYDEALIKHNDALICTRLEKASDLTPQQEKLCQYLTENYGYNDDMPQLSCMFDACRGAGIIRELRRCIMTFEVFFSQLVARLHQQDLLMDFATCFSDEMNDDNIETYVSS